MEVMSCLMDSSFSLRYFLCFSLKGSFPIFSHLFIEVFNIWRIESSSCECLPKVPLSISSIIPSYLLLTSTPKTLTFLATDLLYFLSHPVKFMKSGFSYIILIPLSAVSEPLWIILFIASPTSGLSSMVIRVNPSYSMRA